MDKEKDVFPFEDDGWENINTDKYDEHHDHHPPGQGDMGLDERHYRRHIPYGNGVRHPLLYELNQNNGKRYSNKSVLFAILIISYMGLVILSIFTNIFLKKTKLSIWLNKKTII